MLISVAETLLLAATTSIRAVPAGAVLLVGGAVLLPWRGKLLQHSVQPSSTTGG